MSDTTNNTPFVTNGIAGTDLRVGVVLWRRDPLENDEPPYWYEMYSGCVVSGVMLGIVDAPCKAGEHITVTVLWKNE